MGMREDFTEHALLDAYDIDTNQEGEYKSTATRIAFRGYQMRQPEIDALKCKLDLAINDARNFCQIGLNNWSEIQRLKAENERLRADAERHRFQNAHNFRFFPDSGEWEVPGFKEDTLASGNADTYEQAIDAAIKYFSTTQKEKECDS